MIRLPKTQRVFALAADAPPAARVPDGARVELETADCFSDQIRRADDRLEAVDWEQINPATGPVFVEGARPGDVLAVEIERIEMADQGVMAVSDGFGVLAERFSGTECRLVPIADDIAHLPGGVRVPVRPMIGVLGVAPAGAAVPTGTPGPHGGNMDTTLIGEGATVYLPIAAPGALLAAGDLHAVMGDGEICGTGVEVAGRVTLRVTVRRDLALVNPLVETTNVVATVASAPTLDEAGDPGDARHGEPARRAARPRRGRGDDAHERRWRAAGLAGRRPAEDSALRVAQERARPYGRPLI